MTQYDFNKFFKIIYIYIYIYRERERERGGGEYVISLELTYRKLPKLIYLTN